MTAPWRKAVRDLGQESARTLLVVLAIALGIAGFAAVLSSFAILTRSLNEGYLATNPPSAILRTDAIDDAIVRSISSRPDLAAAEARRAVAGRIKVGPAQWRSLTLFVVRDYRNIRLGRLVPEKGAWPPAAGEVLIERDALAVARARIGGAVTVKTARGVERTLRVSGTVHDVGQAQARMENVVYGYITLATLTRLGEEPYLDRLSILVAERGLDKAHIRRVAAEVARALEREGHPVRRIEIPEPGEHPHARLMGLLLLSMASFGLFVLLLSGVLVVNLTAALMASQVRQIGVMKAVGATRGQAAWIYFVQALFLGVAALLVAVPFGNLGARALCRSMAVFLNFDVPSFAVPAWVYVLVAAVGLLVPLLAAAYPVWKGCGISVHEALSDFGVTGSSFGASAFDRTLAGLSGGIRPLLLVLRNVFRRRARLALTVLTLAVGGVFFLAALNVRASLISTLDRLFGARKFDLAVRLAEMSDLDRIERAAHSTPGVLQVEGWIATEGSLTTQPGERAADRGGPSIPGSHAKAGAGESHGDRESSDDRFTVIALSPATRMLAPQVVEGRGLTAADDDAIVVNDALAARSRRPRVGERLDVRLGPLPTSWRVVGVVREPFSPPGAYVPKSFFDRRGHERQANAVRLTLARTDERSIDAVKGELESRLEREGIRALTSTSKADSRLAFDQHMLMIYVFLVVTSCLIGGVGGLGLATATSLNVRERRRELGILSAVGASPLTVASIVVAEGAAVALVGWVIAALAAWPVSAALGALFSRLLLRGGLDFSFDFRGLWIWLLISLGLGAISSALPAWRASQRPLRESLSYE